MDIKGYRNKAAPLGKRIQLRICSSRGRERKTDEERKGQVGVKEEEEGVRKGGIKKTKKKGALYFSFLSTRTFIGKSLPYCQFLETQCVYGQK